MIRLNTIKKMDNIHHIFFDEKTEIERVPLNYIISQPGVEKDDDNYPDYDTIAHIEFQDDEHYGVTEVDLLEIIRDRLKYKCLKENSHEKAEALKHVEIAIMYLNKYEDERNERLRMMNDMKLNEDKNK